MKRWRAQLAFLGAYMGTNLQMALEYRASFVSQIVGMFINDGLWLVFWALYFTRFPVIRGWERADVLILWAVLTLGYGLLTGFFGNALRLSELILQGQLDYYLVLPKDVLLHSLLGRMYFTAWGDALFGLIVFLLFGQPTPLRLVLFLTVAVIVGIILVAFFVLAHSLTFFIGSSQLVAQQLTNAMIHFSTYPGSIFQGAVKIILYTLIPAGFINTIPVALLRVFDWRLLAELTLVALVLVVAARWLFYAGLRRYESGNLLNLQG